MDDSKAELAELCPNEPLQPPRYTDEKESTSPSREDPTDETLDQGPCENRSKSKWSPVLGYLSVLGVAMACTVSTGGAQCLGGSVPRYELNFARFLIMCALSPPVIIYKKINISPGRSKGPIIALCIFCCSSCVYNLAYYEATIYLPSATLGGVETSLVLIFTAVIQVLFSNKKCRLQTALSMLICLAGIILTTQPVFLFKIGSSGSDQELYTTRPLCEVASHDDGSINVSLLNNIRGVMNQNLNDSLSSPQSTVITSSFHGFILVLCSASMYVGMIFSVKYLQDMPTFALLFWKGISGAVISAVIMLAVEVPTFPKSPLCVGLLFSHSINAALADLLMLVGIALLPPLTFSVLINLVLVGLLCSQYTVLRHVNPGHHNALEVVGVVVILTGCILEPIYTLCQMWRENKAV